MFSQNIGWGGPLADDVFIDATPDSKAILLRMAIDSVNTRGYICPSAPVVSCNELQRPVDN